MKKILILLLSLILGINSFSDFLGEYYSGRNFDTYIGSRVDSEINFDWGNGNPGGEVSGVGNDNFSVRWTAKITAPVRRQYEFQTYTDDGVRLYVNNTLDIDNWVDSAPFYSDGRYNFDLRTGETLNLLMEYYEHTGGAVSRLEYRTRDRKNSGNGWKNWTGWVLLPSSVTELANQKLNGSFESLTGSVASGWAYDPDTSSPIDLKVYVNGSYWKSLKTNVFRDDVNGGGNYGFNIDLATYTTNPGTYSVSIYGVDSNTTSETQLNNSPRNYIIGEKTADPIQNIIFNLTETKMIEGSGNITKTDTGLVTTPTSESKLANISSSINYDGTMDFVNVKYGTGTDNVFVLKQNLPVAHNDVGRAKISRLKTGTTTGEMVDYNFVYPVGFDSFGDAQTSGDRITLNWVENNINKYRVYFKNQKIVFRLSKYGTMKNIDPYLGKNTQIREAETEENGETYLRTMLNSSDQYVDVVFDYYDSGSKIINDVLFSYSSGEVSIIGLPIDFYRVQIYSIRESINGAYTAYTLEGEKIVESSIPKLDEYEITANSGVYLIDHIEKKSFPNIEVYFSTKTPFNAEIDSENIFYNNDNQLEELNENSEKINVLMGEAVLQTAELRDFKYPLDIVFAIDNSGSMQEEINSVKEGLDSFVDKLSAKGFDVKMNIVTFGPQQNYKYVNYYYNGTYTTGYPVGSWYTGNSFGKVEAYYDNDYLAVYKKNSWFSDVNTVKDAFGNMLALSGYYGGQENGAWAIHHATDLLKRNGRTMRRDGTIVDMTSPDYDGGEAGAIASQKWIMILTDENMDDDNLSGMNEGYTTSNVVSELSKGIAENGIIFTGIFHVRNGVRDDLGNQGVNPSDTGDVYYNSFETYLGDSFYMYEMGSTGGLVGNALLDSIGNVGIIKRWKVAYTTPFPDKDGTYRFVNFDLENVLDETGIEVEVINKNDNETKKYKAPTESGAVLNGNFVNPNYEEIISNFQGGGDINDFSNLLRYRDLYGDYGKVESGTTNIIYNAMSKTDDTIIVYKRDKNSSGEYKDLWTISTRNNTKIDISVGADENQDGIEPVKTSAVVENSDKEYFMAMYPDRGNSDNQIIAENFDGFGTPLIYNKMEISAIEGIKTNIYRIKLKYPSKILLENIEKGKIFYSVHERGSSSLSRLGEKKYTFNMDKLVKISREGSADVYYIYKEDIDVNGLTGTTGEIRVYINFDMVVMKTVTRKDILLGIVKVEKDFLVNESLKPKVELIEGTSYVSDGIDNYLKINVDGSIFAGARTMDSSSHMDMGRIAIVDYTNLDVPSYTYDYSFDLEIEILNEVKAADGKPRLIDLNEETEEWQDFSSSLNASRYDESKKYLVMAMARNNAGVSNFIYQLLKLDKTPPTILESDVYKEESGIKYIKIDELGLYLNPSVTASDAGSGLAKVTIELIDQETGLVVATGEKDAVPSNKDEQTITVDGISIADVIAEKKYSIKVTVEDLAGTKTEELIENLELDLTAPEIISTDIYVESNGKKYIKVDGTGTKLDMNVVAKDSESGLNKVRVEIFDSSGNLVLSEEIQADPTNKEEQTISINTAIAGKLISTETYKVRITAIDLAGKASLKEEKELKYDGTNPTYTRSDIYEELTVNGVKSKYLKVDDSGVKLAVDVTGSDLESGLKEISVEIWESNDNTIDSLDRFIMKATVASTATGSESIKEQKIELKNEIPKDNTFKMNYEIKHLVKITVTDKSGRETEEIIGGIKRQPKLNIALDITNPAGNEFATEEIIVGEKYIIIEGTTKATGEGSEYYMMSKIKYEVSKHDGSENISGKEWEFTTEGLSNGWYSTTELDYTFMWKNITGEDAGGREFKIKIPVNDFEQSNSENFDLKLIATNDWDIAIKEIIKENVYYDPVKPILYSFSVSNTSLRESLESLKNDGAELKAIVGAVGNLDSTTELKYGYASGTADADFNLDNDGTTGANYLKKGDNLHFELLLRDSSFLKDDGTTLENVKAYGDFSNIKSGSGKVAGQISKTANEKEIKVVWDIKVDNETANGIASVGIEVSDNFGNKYEGDFEIGYIDNIKPKAGNLSIGIQRTKTDYSMTVDLDEIKDLANGKTGIRAFIIRYDYDYTQSDWPRTYAAAEQTKVNHHLDKQGENAVWLAATDAVLTGSNYKGTINKKVDTISNNNDGKYTIKKVYTIDYAGNISGGVASIDEIIADKTEKTEANVYYVDTIKPGVLKNKTGYEPVLKKTVDANGIDIISDDYVKEGDRAYLKFWVVDAGTSTDPADYTTTTYPAISSLSNKTGKVIISDVLSGQGTYKELTYVEIRIVENGKTDFEITEKGTEAKSLKLYAGTDLAGNKAKELEEFHGVQLDNTKPDITQITQMQIVPKETEGGWGDVYSGIKWNTGLMKTEDKKVDWAFTTEGTAYIAWKTSDSEDPYAYSINGTIGNNVINGKMQEAVYTTKTFDGSGYKTISIAINPGTTNIELYFYDKAGNRIGPIARKITRDEVVAASLLNNDKLALTGIGGGDVDGYFEIPIKISQIEEMAGMRKYQLNIKNKATGIVIPEAKFTSEDIGWVPSGTVATIGEIGSLSHYPSLTQDTALKNKNIKIKLPKDMGGQKMTLELIMWDQLGNNTTNSADYLIVIPSQTIRIISTEEGKDKKIETEMSTNSADVFEVKTREESGIKKTDIIPESLKRNKTEEESGN